MNENQTSIYKIGTYAIFGMLLCNTIMFYIVINICKLLTKVQIVHLKIILGITLFF